MAKEKATYRLQIVLDQRVREKDECIAQVQAAKDVVVFEEKKLEQLCEMRAGVTKRKDQTTEDFQDSIGQAGVSVGEAAFAHDRYQEVLDKEARAHDEAIVKQKMQIERAKQNVKKAEAALLEATINVQAMNKHKEEWAKQVKLEEQRLEQERQEEIGEAMWLQNRRRNS